MNVEFIWFNQILSNLSWNLICFKYKIFLSVTYKFLSQPEVLRNENGFWKEV